LGKPVAKFDEQERGNKKGRYYDQEKQIRHFKYSSFKRALS